MQGYANYPGRDRIVLYENAAELVREKLARKRKEPRRVYFSSSSDAFQNVPAVQNVSFETMRALLEAGVEVAFLTKGIVGERFIEPFACTPHLTFAQVGITTLQGSLSTKIEPSAASPLQRLNDIASLTRVGVSVTARLDPLVPNVTDTREGIVPLLSALRRTGIGPESDHGLMPERRCLAISAIPGRLRRRKNDQHLGSPSAAGEGRRYEPVAKE